MADASAKRPAVLTRDQDIASAEAAFRALVETSPVGAFICFEGRLQYVNARLAEIFGVPPTDLIGTSFVDLLAAAERAAAADRFQRLGRDLSELHFETRAHKKSGLRLFLEVYATRAQIASRSAVVGTVLDVTERTLTVEHLNEQLEFISAITTNLGAGIFALDENGLVTFVNQAAEEALGWMQYELIAKPLHAFIHPRDTSDCPLATRTKVVNAECEFHQRAGGTIPVSYTISPLQSHRGTTGAVIIFQDITERKIAEETLRQSEQDYRGLFDNARDAILIVDAVSEEILEVNQQACKLYGFTHDEFVGQPLSAIATERSFGRINLRETLRKLGSLHFESVQHRKGGAEVDVEMSTALLSYKGKPAILCINRDITERKRIEAEQLRLQNAIKKAALEWQTTFDSITSPIVILGLDGTIARLNRAARDLAGRDYRELLGLRLDQVAPGEPWQMAAQQIRIAGEAAPVAFCQVVDTTEDKTWDLSVTQFGGRGVDEERFIVIMRDVTEVVKMQESLHRSEHMSAMGSLVAGVAHEVRNPLFGMSATLDAFEASFGSVEYGDYISQLREQIDRLNSLMRGLLDYGKPAVAELAPAHIENVINLAVQEARQGADPHQVTLEAETAASLPQIMMDRTRVFQVFENLIRNAIQHSSPGQKVTVQTRMVVAEGTAWVESVVLDEGPGFRPEDIRHIFEPFFTRRRGGTGLGLSIVQKIVDEHGGTITPGNRPGGGAMMTVRFPVLS